MARLFLAALISLALLGCQTTSGNFCDVASPIRPSVQDGMTDGTKRQVIAHNVYGERSCGWRP